MISHCILKRLLFHSKRLRADFYWWTACDKSQWKNDYIRFTLLTKCAQADDTPTLSVTVISYIDNYTVCVHLFLHLNMLGLFIELDGHSNSLSSHKTERQRKNRGQRTTDKATVLGHNELWVLAYTNRSGPGEENTSSLENHVTNWKEISCNKWIEHRHTMPKWNIVLKHT